MYKLSSPHLGPSLWPLGTPCPLTSPQLSAVPVLRATTWISWRQDAHLASDAGCCLLPLLSGLLSLHGSQGAWCGSNTSCCQAVRTASPELAYPGLPQSRAGCPRPPGDMGTWQVPSGRGAQGELVGGRRRLERGCSRGLGPPCGCSRAGGPRSPWRLGAEPLCVPTRQSLARRQPWQECRLGEVGPWGWGQWLVGMQLRAHLPSSCLGLLALRRSALQALGELCASRRRKGSVLFNAAEGQVGCGQGTVPCRRGGWDQAPE